MTEDKDALSQQDAAGQPDTKRRITVEITLTSLPVNNPIDAFTFYTEVLVSSNNSTFPNFMLAIVASGPKGMAPACCWSQTTTRSPKHSRKLCIRPGYQSSFLARPIFNKSTAA